MPFKIDKVSDGVFFARLFGEVSFDDLTGVREAALVHPDYDPSCNTLLDCREAEFLAPETFMAAAGQRRAKSPVVVRGAILVNKKDFGIWRMYQGWAGGDEQLLITTDIKEAREWLGLPED